MAIDFKGGLLSANQRYKQSGSSLPFKEWLNREKAKGIVIPKNGVTDVYEEKLKELNELANKVSITDPMVDKRDIKPKKVSKKVLGLDRNLLIVSGLLIVGAFAYNYYRKTK